MRYKQNVLDTIGKLNLYINSIKTNMENNTLTEVSLKEHIANLENLSQQIEDYVDLEEDEY